MSKLQFEHPDYINSKGEKIPSVTQVIALLNHEGFMEWANYLGLIRHVKVKDFMDHAAYRGSVVHDRIARTFQGDTKFETLSLEIEAEVNILFDRFLIWKEEAEPAPIEVERRYQNEEYGGTVDLICKTKQGPTILIDFKTSTEPKAQYMLQLGGYLNLIKENDPELYDKIDMCQVITLGGKRMQIVTRIKEDMVKYQEAFERLFQAYLAWKKLLGDNWKEKMPK